LKEISMKLRDKEKSLIVDTFLKTAEYVISIMVLGTLISDRFNIPVLLLVFLFSFH